MGVKRFSNIDVLKAIGIIFMIMGHIEYGSYFNHYIHAFHVPLFYIISGYLYKNNVTLNIWVQKKIKLLLVPYFSFGVIFLIITFVMSFSGIIRYESFFEKILHFLLINTDGMAIGGAIWFLTSIFWIEIIYYLIDNYSHLNIKKYIIIVLYSLGILIPLTGYRLPWALDVSFMGVLLFHIGQLFKEKQAIIDKKIKGYQLLIIFIVCSLLIFFNGEVNLRLGIYSNPVLYLINVIMMSYVLYRISVIIAEKKIPLLEEFKYIGVNSLVYLCMNEFIISPLRRLNAIIMNMDISVIGYKLCELVIVMVILHLVSRVINSRHIKWMLGK